MRMRRTLTLPPGRSLTHLVGTLNSNPIWGYPPATLRLVSVKYTPARNPNCADGACWMAELMITDQIAWVWQEPPEDADWRSIAVSAHMETAE